MNKGTKKIILDDMREYLRKWDITEDALAQKVADTTIDVIEKACEKKKDPIRVFLSLPMSGRGAKEIRAQIEEMKSEFLLKNPLEKGTEIIFVDNFDEMEVVTNTYDPLFGIRKTPALHYLGRAINKMAYCDAVYFGKGYTKARGCMIEYQIAIDYHIPAYCNVGDLIRSLRN